MSCNGCRVLRKGCSEGCALRPCLEWIESAEAQGFATLFLAKFFGRAGLMEFITAVPLSQRTALFQSLLYEACGRTVNPVYGAVGLLYSGKWHLCQEAVETILNGGNLHTNMMSTHNDNASNNFSTIKPSTITNVACIEGSQAILPSRSLHAQSDQRPNIARKSSISIAGFHSLEERMSFNNAHKKLKISSENLESRSLILQGKPRQGILTCNYTTNMHRHTSCSCTMIQHSESQCCTVLRPDFEKHPFTSANQEVHLALTLRSNEQGGPPTIDRKEGVSSPSEGSIITSLRSPLLPSSSCHHLQISPSSKAHQNKKLLNLLI